MKITLGSVPGEKIGARINVLLASSHFLNQCSYAAFGEAI